ncbi:60S Ribosomal Protein L12 [Manis pentadactyla]|nr:60S Ribosomal Protein L12 [Manis pentadactyla]
MRRVGFGVRFRDQGRSCSYFLATTEDIVFAHPHVGLRLGTAPVPPTTESGKSVSHTVAAQESLESGKVGVATLLAPPVGPASLGPHHLTRDLRKVLPEVLAWPHPDNQCLGLQTAEEKGHSPHVVEALGINPLHLYSGKII